MGEGGLMIFSKVIITSYLFPNAIFSQQRLEAVLKALEGDTEKLVIDLSCRRKGNSWFVATNRWQTVTDFELSKGLQKHTL
jgi:phosphoribosylformimino-5-aminoimidazole carboxamide ribotide isomerase